jgi:2-oxoglutarate dehydrogenase E2 component (dihydrolipoamide succinyltransferase)
MVTDIVVPHLGDSVLEATIIKWVKQEGDFVNTGDTILELETEKANFEVAAETSGVLKSIGRIENEDVEVGDVLGSIDSTAKPSKSSTKMEDTPIQVKVEEIKTVEQTPSEIKATPVAHNIAKQENIDLSHVVPTGVGNKITKDDVNKYLQSSPGKTAKSESVSELVSSELFPSLSLLNSNRERRVKMSRRRRTIARRLKEAQNIAAILTTFNEIDMSGVLDLRKRRKDDFKERYGVGLGLTSFFVKACVGALKLFPELNAEIQDEEIVYKYYYDIGVAIGAEEGLVVPVIRDADRKSFAEIEQDVKDYSVKTNEGTLTLDELMGGTFSISNGGVFGSLMSTPIINPPQVGILGLHKINQKPVVVDGEIVIRPMMYVALSYDHRIVDGREAVQYLVKIKELIEDPEALLIEG